MVIPGKGNDVAQRTCEVDGCDRKHQARGMCVSHWSAWYRQQFKESGQRSHHPRHLRTCVTCGAEWFTPRREAKFCTAKCKGVYLSERNRRKSKLPVDHPVMLLIAEAKRAEATERAAARREAQRSKFEWRTARECPGCACWFSPLYTPNAVTCSRSCAKRCARRRRRAREHDARGSWTWSQFMAIARKFGYCCAYCGTKRSRLDPDHVVPLSRGGYDSPSNLLPACAMCNSSKCAMTLDEWDRWRADRGMEPRITSWSLGDQRFSHLTQALLGISPAA